MLAEVRDGFHELRSRTWVWATLAASCVALFTALAPWFVLGPVVAREHYGAIGVYGVVTAAVGAGTIAGSLAGIARAPAPADAPGLSLRDAVAAVRPALRGRGPARRGHPGQVAAGAGLALFDVWWLTALAQRIPPDKLSRVTSSDWMVSLGLLPLGYLVAGPLADALGAVPVLLGGSAIGLVALAVGLVPRERRTLERIDDASPGEPLGEAHPGVPVA